MVEWEPLTQKAVIGLCCEERGWAGAAALKGCPLALGWVTLLPSELTHVMMCGPLVPFAGRFKGSVSLKSLLLFIARFSS